VESEHEIKEYSNRGIHDNIDPATNPHQTSKFGRFIWVKDGNQRNSPNEEPKTECTQTQSAAAKL
jgi:hypothetical protein